MSINGAAMRNKFKNMSTQGKIRGLVATCILGGGGIGLFYAITTATTGMGVMLPILVGLGTLLCAKTADDAICRYIR